MTQGGMQAYGASAGPAPDLETPPLLHYILPLTQEGLLHASSSVISLFGKGLAHLSGSEYVCVFFFNLFQPFFKSALLSNTTGIQIKHYS